MSSFLPIQSVQMSAEQYLLLGEDPPGARLELVEGRLIVGPGPSRGHAGIVFALAYMLETHIRKHSLGKLYLDTDVVIDRSTVRRPDIAFYSAATLLQMRGELLDRMPELCVEVLSPSNAEDDRVNKFALYAARGVRHYWMVDSQGRTVEGYVLEGGEYRLVGKGGEGEEVRLPPFEALGISLGELWAGN